jgi:hypothetical protein
MSCQKCNSQRIAEVSGKCADCCGVTIGNVEHEGYVPNDLGIGGGDYISFSWCLDCGQLQGKFPVAPAEMEKDISDDEVLDFFNNHFTPGTRINSISAKLTTNYIESAEFVGRKLGKFLQHFFNYNGDASTDYKMPTAEKFLEMYKTNKPYMELY